ncbi:hypothetical protein PS655_05543 [Pseudomonas fluorescens]|uniref:Uncharacterized protein n=1 Tax=Pseudomonas fluorescens TaxID=294 RepID=A0A5E6XLZ1_PSEFL|nr:hypothetical protein PS655_05543 [Pseudomonas fluorescens]
MDRETAPAHPLSEDIAKTTQTALLKQFLDFV